jgi:hypothetical protein
LAGTQGAVQSIVFDPGEALYTIRYMVRICAASASFRTTVNGVEADQKTVNCAAAAIGVQAELIGRTRADDVTAAGLMSSGQTERLTLQGRDQHGNLITSGGEQAVLAIDIVEPIIENPTPVAGPPVSSLLDVGDGTYRIAYTVRYSGRHVINIKVRDAAGVLRPILGSPFYVDVLPGDLLPSNSYANLPATAQVATLFPVSITQRDANGNLIAAVMAGSSYIVVVGPETFENPDEPLTIFAEYTVSGVTVVEVKYRDQGGSIYDLGCADKTLDVCQYTITLLPGLAVPQKTIILEEYTQMAKDCIATKTNEIMLQTRDEFENECQVALLISIGEFRIHVGACDDVATIECPSKGVDMPSCENTCSTIQVLLQKPPAYGRRV